MTTSELPSSLSQPTTAHCAAVFFGDLADLVFQGSDRYRVGQGTITFIRYRGRLLGVTNRHVTHAGDADRRHAGAVYLVALAKHTHLVGRLLELPAELDGFDLSFYLLPTDFLAGSAKLPINLDESPSRPLKQGDMCLAVGFPGMLRDSLDQFWMAHGLVHVVSTCQDVTDRNILSHDVVEGEHIAYKFGGMSGGPLFSIDDEQYQFHGIVHAGSGYGDSASGNAIWIYAHPLSADMLERVFAFNAVGDE